MWGFLVSFFLSFPIQTIISFPFSQENSLGKGECKPTCHSCFPEEAKYCGISAADTMVTSRMMLGPGQAERDRIILSLDLSLGLQGASQGVAIELLRLVVRPCWCKDTDNGPDKYVALGSVWATLQIHTLPPEGYCDVSLPAVQTRSTEGRISQKTKVEVSMETWDLIESVRRWENPPGETCTTFLRLEDVPQDTSSCFVLYLTNPWGYQIFCVIHTVQSRLDKCFPLYFFFPFSFFSTVIGEYFEKS